MTTCKAVSTPGVDESLKRSADQEAIGTQLLDPASSTQYRALTARANYVVQGRAEANNVLFELLRHNLTNAKYLGLSRYFSVFLRLLEEAQLHLPLLDGCGNICVSFTPFWGVDFRSEALHPLARHRVAFLG